MRILLTTDTVGGVWTFTQDLTVYLLGEHEIAMISFGREPSPEQARWVRGMRTQWSGLFTFQASAAPLEWMPDNGHAYTLGAPILERVASEFKPEILHFNQFCFGDLPRHGVFDIPRVITAHSDVLSWVDCCRPGEPDNSRWLRDYVRLVTQGLAGADLLTAPTGWMLDTLRQNFPLTCQSAVIPNGTRTPEDAAPKLPRKLQAVTAGRLWDEGKGLSILAEIHPSMPVLVAGEDSFAGSATPVPPEVTPLGTLEHAQLLQLFRQSSIYLCTSIYEPFGLAPLEAAMNGCALLLRDLPSLREIWGDVAVYFQNTTTLQAELARFVSDASHLHARQQAAAERARQFPASRTAERYAALYAELLAPHSPVHAESYAG